jgi:hypothetical protein
MECDMAMIQYPGLDPAFPPPGGGNKQGLTIRDYFAATALVGLATAFAGELDERSAEIAGQAYALADAMIKARV